MKRSSGVLLHPTSLPGGVSGTLGGAARAFVDFLEDAGQSWWQMLPVNPPGLGGSPYMATSAFAGSPALLDPVDLVADGLLKKSQVPVTTTGRIDFTLVESETERLAALLGAAVSEDDASLAAFSEATPWLEDFATYSVLSARYEGRPWTKWASEHRDRDAAAIAELDARKLHAARVGQYLFAKQWRALREYATKRGVQLIGDIPIFVAHGSADVWANRELFQLDASGDQVHVAGVPPDYFSETGQRWGNPLYEWEKMAANGYRWWTDRFAQTFDNFSCVRVDHFRAFAAYWSIPSQEPTAINGSWLPGPGLPFFEKVASNLSAASPAALPIILEDLGIITPDVDQLRSALGRPGMKVLQFSFDEDWNNVHKPHNYPEDGKCVVYTGTHDNDTAQGWFDAASEEDKERGRSHLQVDGRAFGRSMLEAAWKSSANLAIAPIQDVLNFNGDARMNTPGTPEGNWGWRMERPASVKQSKWLRSVTEASGR
ncbi:MAG: 4-alpha-glucanotransferase [Bradymonadia bacterium]|jgi:4-alpha-glucanotransferase